MIIIIDRRFFYALKHMLFIDSINRPYVTEIYFELKSISKNRIYDVLRYVSCWWIRTPVYLPFGLWHFMAMYFGGLLR